MILLWYGLFRILEAPAYWLLQFVDCLILFSDFKYKMNADFHKLAKDAGNKLRAYILTYASAATGVFFLALVGKESVDFSFLQKIFLLSALALYVVTVIICLFELNVDSRRFFYVASQIEKPVHEQDWNKNRALKEIRLKLIFTSYITSGLATLFILLFLFNRIYLF